MPGLAKRRLYKPERKPARKRGVIGECSPVGVPDASPSEVINALAAIGMEAGFRVGRGGDYDRIADVYTVVGKGILDGRACDAKIAGSMVADVITTFRMMRDGIIDPMTGHLIHQDSGLLIL